jgi:hypothetical protein
MADQYKLRLGDGTVLAVDEQGLRAWVLDAKAMVQRPGSSAWRPLPDVLAAIDDGVPIIPFKAEPVDAPVPAKAPSGDLREIAAAALDPEGAGDAPRSEARPRVAVPPANPGKSASPAKPAVGPTAGPKPFVPDPKGREVQVRQGPVDPRAIVYPPVPGEAAVRTALEWSGTVASQAGKLVAHLPPPPSLPAITERVTSPAARQRLKGGLIAALSLAAALLLGFGAWSVWSRTAEHDAGAATTATPPTLPPPPPTVPELPKEVQEAMAQLPHLSPDTIQLVMAGDGTRITDPPELFRRAYLAAEEGTTALSEDEARELKGLMNGVLGNLRRVDRDRVRAYGRLNRQRDLLVGEDRKVAALFARGVRALPAPKRERLQELSAKAIASSLPKPSSSPGTVAAR